MVTTVKNFSTGSNVNDGGNYAWIFPESALVDDAGYSSAGLGQLWGPNNNTKTQLLTIGGDGGYTNGVPASGLNSSGISVKGLSNASPSIRLSQIRITQPTTGITFAKTVNQTLTATDTTYTFSLLTSDWISIADGTTVMSWGLDDLKSLTPPTIQIKAESNSGGSSGSGTNRGPFINYVSITNDVDAVSFPVVVTVPNKQTVLAATPGNPLTVSDQLTDGADYTYKNAGTCVSVSGPSIQWTNPAAAQGPLDNITASMPTPSTTASNNAYLRGTNFGFNIPENAIIAAVEIGVSAGRIGGSSGNVILDDLRVVHNGSVLSEFTLGAAGNPLQYYNYNANGSNLPTARVFVGGTWWIAGSPDIMNNVSYSFTSSSILYTNFIQISSTQRAVFQINNAAPYGIDPATMTDPESLVIGLSIYNGSGADMPSVTIGPYYGDGQTTPVGASAATLWANSDVSGNNYYSGPLVFGSNWVILRGNAAQDFINAFAAGDVMHLALNTTTTTQSNYDVSQFSIQMFPGGHITREQVNSSTFGSDFRFRSVSGNRTVVVDCFENLIYYYVITPGNDPVLVIEGSRIDIPSGTVEYISYTPDPRLKMKIDVPTKPVVTLTPRVTPIGEKINLDDKTVLHNPYTNVVDETILSQSSSVIITENDQQLNEKLYPDVQDVFFTPKTPAMLLKSYINVPESDADFTVYNPSTTETTHVESVSVDYEPKQITVFAPLYVNVPAAEINFTTNDSALNETVKLFNVPSVSITEALNTINESVIAGGTNVDFMPNDTIPKETLHIAKELINYYSNDPTANEKIYAPMADVSFTIMGGFIKEDLIIFLPMSEVEVTLNNVNVNGRDNVSVPSTSSNHTMYVAAVDETIIAGAEFVGFIPQIPSIELSVIIPTDDVIFDESNPDLNETIDVSNQNVGVVPYVSKLNETAFPGSESVSFNTNPIKLNEAVYALLSNVIVNTYNNTINEQIKLSSSSVEHIVNSLKLEEKVNIPASEMTADMLLALINEHINTIDMSSVSFESFAPQPNESVNVQNIATTFYGFEDPNLKVTVIMQPSDVEFDVNNPNTSFNSYVWGVVPTEQIISQVDTQTANIIQQSGAQQFIWIMEGNQVDIDSEIG